MAEMNVESVFISAVTEAELLYGLARLRAAFSPRVGRPGVGRSGVGRMDTLVKKFLTVVRTLPWDSEAAAQYGVLRASLERRGMPMDNLDLMIGAHALAQGAVLVTNDDAFDRIENLQLENWTTG
jgi:tRNA(fMet)-specific endonuclease VapC